MTSPRPLAEACFAYLVRCLRTVAEGCAELEADALALHRLRNLVQVLPSTAPSLGDTPSPGLTLDLALTLVSTSQGLLATLRDAREDSLVSAGMDQALSETLAALADRMGAALRQQQAGRIRGLYVIIDPQVTNGRNPMEVARAAVRGGARMLQLRDKLRDKGEVLPLATELQQLCQANGVALIINDHADLAAVVGSAGVHLGQTDLPVAQARRVLSPRQVLGRSNHEIEELVRSQEMGADHVAFGAIYQTGTKGVGRPPQGIEQLRRAREVTKVPLVAIGGINADNVAPVVAAGADAVCVTAAVGMAPDPEAAAARLVKAITGAGGRA
jgi:thiamine-phosphate diphosphorylase